VKRKHFISHSERQRSLLWLVIIVVVALILGALVAKIPTYVEKFYGYMDESYRPMDLDRDPDRDKSDYIYYKE